MSVDEQLARFALLQALSTISTATGIALQALAVLEYGRIDAMPDARISGASLVSVGCLFERLGIPAAEVQP